MKKDILHMTDEERWDRVGELLFKGAYLLALKEKEQAETVERLTFPKSVGVLLRENSSSRFSFFFCFFFSFSL